MAQKDTPHPITIVLKLPPFRLKVCVTFSKVAIFGYIALGIAKCQSLGLINLLKNGHPVLRTGPVTITKSSLGFSTTQTNKLV
jgi:hypothetical protein